MKRSHKMQFGAECRENGTTRFRLWAPKARSVSLLLPDEQSRTIALSRLEDDWFELISAETRAGTRYHFQIDGQLKVPDPASRFQPLDVNGPSEVIDPAAFEWNDEDWRGRPWSEAVIYELHVGAFTAQGSFAAVQQKLDYLLDLGITALELMPISDFPGKRNWGYDGVLPFAPDSSYGRPEELKTLVEAAHRKGLMVLLDVVYNHFGPEGNYLRSYSPEFFTERHHTPWGEAINFDGPRSRLVRDYFIQNALYWLEEYHFDGLRFDAVHTILDDSAPDFLTAMAETVRSKFGSDRFVHLILENYNNDAHYLESDALGRARWYNAQWNDDVHHAAHVLVTGETDGYYSDYAQYPIQQLGRCLSEGFAYQGEVSAHRGAKRGKSSRGLPPTSFISFLQNHDQIGNRAFGERILKAGNSAAVKAIMEILLLAPSVPLLFMGEEFAATTPFLFFCDFEGELATKVTQGRRSEFAGFKQFNSIEMRSRIPDPNSEQTFVHSKLNWESQNYDCLQFYRGMLALRRKFIIPNLRDAGANAHGSFRTCGDGGLSVAWKLGKATLSLSANLAATPMLLTTRPQGRTIYAGQPDLAVELARDSGPIKMPAWSAAWFLRS